MKAKDGAASGTSRLPATLARMGKPSRSAPKYRSSASSTPPWSGLARTRRCSPSSGAGPIPSSRTQKSSPYFGNTTPRTRRWPVSRWKGDVTPVAIRRRFPYRVELPAGPARGEESSAATWGLAKRLGAAPYPLSAFHDDRHFAAFHFKTAAAALAFRERFGGELLLPIEPQHRRRRSSVG